MISVVSYGGGINSAAVVVGLVERGEHPDLVLFSDTGGERPETYAHINMMFDWCKHRGIQCVTVRNEPESGDKTLEENCLRRKELPSLAYGFKGCSVKWKRQPMDRFLKRHWEPSVAALKRGERITRIIGIDAGETKRKKLPPDKLFEYRYPLVEWGWDRAACVAAITEAGLQVPPKSSCFFCPAMTKLEVAALAQEHPSLFHRAIAMEANSAAHTVVGLGRRWKWSGFAAATTNAVDVPCDCMDGVGED